MSHELLQRILDELSDYDLDYKLNSETLKDIRAVLASPEPEDDPLSSAPLTYTELDKLHRKAASELVLANLTIQELTSPARTAATEPPAAVVGEQPDTWKGLDGHWVPPGKNTKIIFPLKDLPLGTHLFTHLVTVNHVRDTALHEAANICELEGDRYIGNTEYGSGVRYAASMLADLIRAQKSST